jgi:nitrite reductase (NO-forming)
LSPPPPRWPQTISSCRGRPFELVAPPFVHPHEQVTKEGPKIIEFKLTIREKEVVIDDAGTKFQAMTFNGSMPAPMMVVHEGDYVEVTLVNPEANTMPHNVDFHSATGGLGGGALTHVNPANRWCCAGRQRAPARSCITARRKA